MLEIGTGSGYQAAVLARARGEVYTIEIVEPLGEQRGAALTELGYGNVRVRASATATRAGPSTRRSTRIIVTAARAEHSRAADRSSSRPADAW